MTSIKHLNDFQICFQTNRLFHVKLFWNVYVRLQLLFPLFLRQRRRKWLDAAFKTRETLYSNILSDAECPRFRSSVIFAAVIIWSESSFSEFRVPTTVKVEWSNYRILTILREITRATGTMPNRHVRHCANLINWWHKFPKSDFTPTPKNKYYFDTHVKTKRRRTYNFARRL